MLNKKELYASMKGLFHDMIIPDYMRSIVISYVIDHCPVGGFLERVISNDLVGAIGKADNNNIRNIPAYINWFYNYAPTDCWGNNEVYKNWIKK